MAFITSTAQRTGQKFTDLLLAVCFVLGYVLVRLHALLAFPPFIDESWHIGFAQDTLNAHIFVGATHGKLLVPWWLALFQPYGDSQLWVARAATVLFSAISVAVVYKLVSDWATPSIAAFAGLLYIFAPYLFFFERLALTDSYTATFGILALWFSTRLLRRARAPDAILCGLCLVAALGTKGTGIALASIPFVAALLLPRHLRLRQRIRWLAYAYGTLAIIWAPLYLLMTLRGVQYFELASTLSETRQVGDLPRHLLANVGDLWQVDSIYFSPILLLVGCALIVFLLIRRWRMGLFFILNIAVPVAIVLALSPFVRPRYALLHVPILICAFAVGFGALVDELQCRLKMTQRITIGAGTVALLAWIVTFGLPFQRTLWENPSDAPVPQADRLEYFSADSAGFALDRVAAAVLQNAGSASKPQRLIGLISNCGGLAVYIPHNGPVTLECPLINFDGSEQANLAKLVNQRATETATFDLWVVSENLPYVSMEGITAPYEKVVTFDRPDHISHVTLYHVGKAQ